MTRETEEVATEPTPIDTLPWHARAVQMIGAALDAGRLPHGLLLHGPEGVGKERFASAVAAALFCTRRCARFAACGACPDCELSRAGSHPDMHWIRRLEDKRSIGVEQIRDACEQLGMTSMRRGYRVAVVVPAQVMTTSAQNALLKTLEEPAPRTLILLVTSRPSGLLATLRSRCQRVEIARPASTTALAWLSETTGGNASPRLLELAGGAPLKALQLAPHFEALEGQMSGLLDAYLAGRAEVTRTADEMLGEGLPARLDWLENWLETAVRRRTVPDETPLTVPGARLLQRAAAEVNITAAFQVLDRLREARRLLEGSAAPALVVESLLIDVRKALGRRGVI